MKKYHCPSCKIELDTKNIKHRLDEYENKPWYKYAVLKTGMYCPNCGVKLCFNHAGKKWLWLATPLTILLFLSVLDVEISYLISSGAAVIFVFGVMMYAIKSDYEKDE